jgi:type IV pilus assembly protein PilY1
MTHVVIMMVMMQVLMREKSMRMQQNIQSTYLDDVAHYLYTHKVVGDTSNDDVWNGTSNVLTYTVGFMGNQESNLFLINTSNNGNGETNLYNTSDVDYGRWHYVAEDPDDLSAELLAAVNAILSQTSSFTAPVVPVTRTTSGNYIYMAFFTPDETNFWEGNVTKYGIDSTGGTIKIVDKDGNDATYANGAMVETAEPYWETIDWATPGEDNYILYSNRNIYTYPTTSTSTTLTHASNAFNSTNITAAMLGTPTAVTVNGNAVSGVDKVIYYVRGADVFDEDGDGNTIGAVGGDTAENREVITGDVLHSEPLVVYYNSSTTMVYFGANDGMLHAVKDSDDPTDADYGMEKWAFIPRSQLSSLKDMIEGATHQYYLDASPKAYIYDDDEDGEIESADGDKVYLICGEREGGTSYFMLNVTDPDVPVYLGAIGQAEVPELGETWSEPVFGTVKTSGADTPVFFVGGGYSADNSLGRAVAVVDIEDPTDAAGSPIGGILVFQNGHTPSHVDYSETIANMDYSIAGAVTALDIDGNDLVDVVYVGDLGGQIWRIGRFDDGAGTALTFPDSNENITTWTAQRIFLAPSYTVDATTYNRKFFYPPAVTFEKGYHLVFAGTGDRESPCNDETEDRIYCVKDTHAADPEFDEDDLVDVTDPTATVPSLGSTMDVDTNGFDDQGWFIQLATGEKALGEGTVFYRTLYITTFIPHAALADSDPCMPGGLGTLYALNYLTGAAALNFDVDVDLERSVSLGGGIPSKPVMVITSTGQKLFISVGSTNPDDAVEGEDFGAGIVAVDPLSPPANFFLLWWRELFS